MSKKTGRIFSHIGLLLIVVVAAGCAGTPKHNVRTHPDLDEQLLDIDSVLIVTPAVTIEQINFADSNERLPALEEIIKKQLIDLARINLEARGFDVVDFDHEKAISEDEEFAYAVTQAREGFEEVKQTLYGKNLTVEERAEIKVSVGTAVNLVSQKSGADAILLIHYIGLKKSGGSMAKDIAIGVLVGLLTGQAPIAASESSYIELAFIDGVTGNVLWSNMLSAASLNVQTADMVMETFPQDVDAPTELVAQDGEVATKEKKIELENLE